MKCVRSASALLGALVVLLPLAGCSDTETGDPTPQGMGTAGADPGGQSPRSEGSEDDGGSTSSLSSDEDEAPVQAAREWARLAARAINARSADFSETAPVSTPQGRRTMSKVAREDFGLEYPGPLPFTPIEVETQRRTSEIQACWMAYGFALDPSTGLPADAREVQLATLTMAREGKQWKFDGIAFAQDASPCQDVDVKGVAW